MLDPTLVHRPLSRRGEGIVLTHGAGGNCRAPLLVAIAEALCDAGFLVARLNLPFREARPFGPPLPARAADDREALRAAVAKMREAVGRRVFLGGHSYGGRQASILLSEQGEAADGLLLLSYPLHPPKKPADLRTAHFAQLRAPALFVHGTSDPFGTVEEMKAAVTSLAGESRLSIVPGAGHDLERGKFALKNLVIEPFLKLIGSAKT